MNNLQQRRRVALIAFGWFALFFGLMSIGIWLGGERGLEWGFACGMLFCYVAAVPAGMGTRLLILRGYVNAPGVEIRPFRAERKPAASNVKRLHRA